MLAVKTLIKRIRRVVHDVDAITYDDDEILDVINQGIRYIRRTIADNKPEMLAEPLVSGMIKAGESSFDLPYRPLMLLYVRAGNEIASTEEIYSSDKIYHNWNPIYHNTTTKIYSKEIIVTYRTYRVTEGNLSEVYGDLTREGKPEIFYLTGDTTINFYPTPREDTCYEVLAVSDMDDLTIDDTTPLAHEYDGLLVEYANIRLSILNEYDVSSDSQVMSAIQSQILRLLHIPPTGVTVQGYWNPSLMYGKPTRRMW